MGAAKINAYRTFELVVHRHVYIDFSKEGWPPIAVSATEAPAQTLHPIRTIFVRLRDNSGSEKPSHSEMTAFTDGMWGGKIIERGTDRVWLSSGPGWSTEPYKGDWPPPKDPKDWSQDPVSDEFSLHVIPWRSDCDHVLHECQDGCGAKIVVWRDATGVEHHDHEGFETPMQEDDKWRRVGDGYLHEWCRTGWRQVCDARMKWQNSRGEDDEAERIAEYEQLCIQFEERETK